MKRGRPAALPRRGCSRGASRRRRPPEARRRLNAAATSVFCPRGAWPSLPSRFARPQHPLTAAAPHGVGCEVTRGDPGGGGGALFRRSSGRSFRYSLVLEVHPRPAHHLPGSPRSVTSSSSPPLPRPPSGKALATKLALVAPGTGSSATLFESERRRRLSTNLCNAGAGCVGPHHRTPSGSRLPTSRGS